MSLTLFQSGTAWAEWRGEFKKHPTDKSYNNKTTPAIRVWQPHNADFHTPGEILSVHSTDWKETIEIRTFRSTFNKHGHNWYMTSRLDFWFDPEDDPFQWHGYLITGGYNSTFKVRRCIRKNAFTHWDRRNYPPVTVTILPGPVPIWHATFKKGKDRFVVRDPRKGWIMEKSPEGCLRQLVLNRLRIAA